MGFGFDPAFQRELARESWPLYGLGMGFIALRIFARWHRVGFRHFYLDDYLMLLVAAWYTLLVVLLNVIVQGGGSNLFPPDQLKDFTKEDIKERVKGSKLVIVSEQAMLNVIYTIKACVLLMYSRLTTGLKQQFVIKVIAIYAACGWLASELAFFLACRPFDGYWAVPPPNPQCTTLENYAITQATFNISSDLLLLFTMLPLFLTLRLPLAQKLSLLFVFGLGAFVIVAALLNKIFNLTDVYSTVYMLWYVREASTAVYVSNIPLIWPLLREWVPFLRHMTPGHKITGESDEGGLGKSADGARDGEKGTLKNYPFGMNNGMDGVKSSSEGTGTGTGTSTTTYERPESMEPIRPSAVAVREHEKSISMDSIKDLERGLGYGGTRRASTNVMAGRKMMGLEKRAGPDDEKNDEEFMDILAAIAAGNGKGRMDGQSAVRR